MDFSYLNYSYLSYFIFIFPVIIISLIAQIRVKTTYRKFSKIQNSKGLTGAQAAMKILGYYGINNVSIEQIQGELSDHFDPKSNVIRLSEKVCNGTSVAAVGVACHEAGHAAQHAEGYRPIVIRNKIIPICTIGSYIGIPLALVGWFFSFGYLIYIGIALYSLIAIFQIATLPIEFNASKRAIEVIDSGNLLTEDEAVGAKRVLSAAAMTYVAALLISLLSILRFIFIFGRRRR